MSAKLLVIECEQDSEMVMIEGKGCYVPAETLDMLNQFRAEYNKCAALLPDSRYLDWPDGGAVEVSEQLRRMIEDLKGQYRKEGFLAASAYDWNRLDPSEAEVMADDYVKQSGEVE